MASSSDRDKNTPDSQANADNPFIKFRNSIDSKISSVLQGIIGLPSAFSKNPNNARWADFDEDMRRRDDLQASQKEIKQSEAKKAEQHSRGWPHRLDSNNTTIGIDDKASRDIPLYSPVSKILWASLPVLKNDRYGGSSEWRPVPESRGVQLVSYPARGLQALWSPIAGLQNAIYADLNANSLLRSQYSLLPYLLFSPYSPIKLGLESEQKGGRDADSWCDAFQDLIIISQGNPTLRPHRITAGADNVYSPMDTAIGPERSWIYYLWASGMLQENTITDKPYVANVQNMLMDWVTQPGTAPAIHGNDEADTELDAYDRFLKRASESTSVAEVLESLFTDAEGWITEQLAATLDPAELDRAMKDFKKFIGQKTGDEVEDMGRTDAVEYLESIIEQTIRMFGQQQENTSGHKRGVENFAETKIAKELEEMKRKVAKEPKNTFVSTTTEHTTHEDGSVETSVTVWKRFPDGRETTTTTHHVEEPACCDDNDDDEDDFEQQTGFPKVPDAKRDEKKNDKKGWFWN